MIETTVKMFVQIPDNTFREDGAAISVNHETIEFEDVVQVQKVTECFTPPVLEAIQNKWAKLQEQHENKCSILGINFSFRPK